MQNRFGKSAKWAGKGRDEEIGSQGGGWKGRQGAATRGPYARPMRIPAGDFHPSAFSHVGLLQQGILAFGAFLFFFLFRLWKQLLNGKRDSLAYKIIFVFFFFLIVFFN